MKKCTTSNETSTKTSKIIEFYILPASTVKAKVLSALNVAVSHHLPSSCAGLNELFKVMFSDSDIAKSFALSGLECACQINF